MKFSQFLLARRSRTKGFSLCLTQWWIIFRLRPTFPLFRALIQMMRISQLYEKHLTLSHFRRSLSRLPLTHSSASLFSFAFTLELLLPEVMSTILVLETKNE